MRGQAPKSPRERTDEIYTVVVDHIRVDPDALLADVATKRPGPRRSLLSIDPRVQDVLRVALSLSDRSARVGQAVVGLWSTIMCPADFSPRGSPSRAGEGV
jgi:hypothetical protein